MTDFLSTVATIVIHTPIWVWPLYALLLFLGFQRTRDSSLPLWRVLVLPLVVTLLAIASLIGAGLIALPTMVLGLVIGSAVGWQLDRDGATRRLPDGRLWLRVEWWTFAQIVLVLVFRYAINVIPAISHTLHANVTWQLSTLFISAALSALFLSRTAARLRVYFGPATAFRHSSRT
jgi:hypothetical protein